MSVTEGMIAGLPSVDVAPRRELAREILDEVEKIILENTYPDFSKNGKPCNIWKATSGYDALADLKKKYTEQAVENAESCIACGEIIPESRQVCPQCEKLH